MRIYTFTITLFIVVFCAGNSFAQKNTCDNIYTIVDQMPVYGERSDEFLKYTMKHLKFKDSCLPVGVIVMSFVINKEGQMTDIDASGVTGFCKTEFLDQMKNLHAWTPGRFNGKLVCVKMSFPIRVCFRN